MATTIPVPADELPVAEVVAIRARIERWAGTFLPDKPSSQHLRYWAATLWSIS